MKHEVINKTKIESEYLGEKSKGIEISVKVHPNKILDKEKQNKNIQQYFIEEIGRELTKEELINYSNLFNQGKTNFWSYAKTIQNKNQV